MDNLKSASTVANLCFVRSSVIIGRSKTTEDTCSCQKAKGEVTVNKDGTKSHTSKGTMKNLNNRAKKLLIIKGFKLPGIPQIEYLD